MVKLNKLKADSLTMKKYCQIFSN